MTTLANHRRGDTFSYTFTLSSGWLGATFTGGVKWTLRSSLPGSSEVDDNGAVAQASVATGGMVFVGAVGTITIPASATTQWRTGRLYWDLQGVISGATPLVYSIDDGTIVVTPDVTRSA